MDREDDFGFCRDFVGNIHENVSGLQIQADQSPRRTDGNMTKLRIKCPHCGCWNRFEVDKIFVPQPSPEPKVKVLIPMYKPLKTKRCKKCGKVIAEPKELIRIMKS